MKIMSSVLICCILGIFGILEAKSQDKNVEQAKELWEKVIAAKGGRENLHKVKTLAVTTKSYSPYDKKEFRNSHYVEFYLLPDKWWWWIDDRPRFNLTIRQYDFGKELGYEVSEGKVTGVYVVESRNKSDYGKQREHQIFDNYILTTNRPKKMQDISKRSSEIQYDESSFNNNIKESFFEWQLTYLMETKWFQPKIERLKTEKVKGKQIEVVEVLFGRLKIEYFIDPKTYLPNRIKIRTWIEETQSYYEIGYFLEDYIEVEGVKLPQIIKQGKKTKTKTVYQVNGKYNEKLFDNPPSIEAGAGAWKAKN